MDIYIDLSEKIQAKIESGQASWVKKKKDGSPAKKKKKRAMNKGEYRDKDGNIKKSCGDEDAGYPPNCNEGYKEKDGKCVPIKKDKEENKLRPGKEDGNQNCPGCY